MPKFLLLRDLQPTKRRHFVYLHGDERDRKFYLMIINVSLNIPRNKGIPSTVRANPPPPSSTFFRLTS
jgi:hypothetical protein